MAVFTPQAIGFVRSPYTDSKSIPKGLGARHDAEGTLEILPEFELGLTDIEGFSHLFVIWAFDRSEGFELIGRAPIDERTHGVFATRSPRRPNPIALSGSGATIPRRPAFACAWRRYAGWHANPRHQALHVEHSQREASPRLGGRGRGAQQELKAVRPVQVVLVRNEHAGVEVGLEDRFSRFPQCGP